MGSFLSLSILLLFAGYQIYCNDSCPCKCPETDEKEKEDVIEVPKRSYDNIRLPKYVKPSHYNVFLDVNMQTKQVEGKADVNITVTKPSKYLVIHAVDFHTISGGLWDARNTAITLIRQFVFEKNQYHVMELASELLPGSYVLRYKYTYMLKEKLSGFYQAKYKTTSGKVKTAAVTQFQPTDARKAFPCFDEPSMRATFDITIAHGKEYVAISNMPIVKTWYDKAGKRRFDLFGRTPPMATYILSFSVCEFANITVTADTKTPVKMTFFAPPEQINQIKYATYVGSKVLAFYEKYFNIPYPLPKADMIAVPDFALNAMENWGIISFRLKALLFDERTSSISSKADISSTVSHELAHMWFGNLVTMEWWSDLWLNEGFATLVQHIGVDAAQPTWKYLDSIVVGAMVDAMTLDALASSHPIYVKVKNPAQINEIFDDISYRKGASVLRMLDNFLGSRTFIKGLNMYLKKYSYGNARTEDLWEELSKASYLAGDRYNVSQIMNTWVLQMGFPVIDVTNTGNGTYKLSQSRFLSDRKPELSNSEFTSPYNYKWIIPFYYVTLDISDGTNIAQLPVKNVWLNMSDASIKVASNNFIIKGNAGQYGFFRVNYDNDGWKKIISILKDNHQVLHVKDRAGLLQDAFALAASGRLGYSVALDLFDYIDNDADFLPWTAAIESVRYIPFVLAQNHQLRKLFQKFMNKKTTNLYMKYQFEPVSGYLKRRLQMLAVDAACGYGNEECLKKASQLFASYMTARKTIPNDFRKSVYYYGVSNGGSKEWDFVFKKYLRTKVATEKSILLYALCATREAGTVDRILQYTLNASIIKSQDVHYVFRYIVENNAHGRYHAWYFLKENWRVVVERFAKQFHTIGRVVAAVTSGFTTENGLKQVNDFFTEERLKGAGEVRRTLKQSMEKVKGNIAWLKVNTDVVEKWLRQKS